MFLAACVHIQNYMGKNIKRRKGFRKICNLTIKHNMYFINLKKNNSKLCISMQRSYRVYIILLQIGTNIFMEKTNFIFQSVEVLWGKTATSVYIHIRYGSTKRNRITFPRWQIFQRSNFFLKIDLILLNCNTLPEMSYKNPRNK